MATCTLLKIRTKPLWEVLSPAEILVNIHSAYREEGGTKKGERGSIVVKRDHLGTFSRLLSRLINSDGKTPPEAIEDFLLVVALLKGGSLPLRVCNLREVVLEFMRIHPPRSVHDGANEEYYLLQSNSLLTKINIHQGHLRMVGLEVLGLGEPFPV